MISLLIDFEKMQIVFLNNKLNLTEEVYEKFNKFTDFLVEKNKVMNLTGITDCEGISEKHILDSLLPMTMIDIQEGSSVIDVGTGAGFPGVPMKLYRDDIHMTLLDSLNKRVNFLEEAATITCSEFTCIHARAEEGGRNEKLREKFDFAVARAVAPLPTLVEYCLPFVKVGGYFLAMKGPNEDISAGVNAINLLGGQIENTIEYSLPCGDKRILVIINKVSSTSAKYPRNAGQIAKKTL